jgi:hypothetical protein
VTAPIEYQTPTGSVIFLPATYVCEDGHDTNAGTAIP